MVAEMIEDYDWESDESENWESDEAFAESEDSAEDIGERARWRRQQRRYPPVRGRQGITVRSPGGGVQRYRSRPDWPPPQKPTKDWRTLPND